MYGSCHIFLPLTNTQARTEAFWHGIETKHFSSHGTKAYGTLMAHLRRELLALLGYGVTFGQSGVRFGGTSRATSENRNRRDVIAQGKACKPKPLLCQKPSNWKINNLQAIQDGPSR